MTSVTLDNGKTYTGWRAVPWIVLFLPVIVPALLLAVGLSLARWLTGRDEVMGWSYHAGTWTRRP